MENELSPIIYDNQKGIYFQNSQTSKYSRNKLNNFSVVSDPEIISPKSQKCQKFKPKTFTTN